MVELAVKRGGGKSDFPLVGIQLFKVVADRPLCFMGADLYAFSAVDTAGAIDSCLPFPDADRFGWTAAQTVGATHAPLRIKGDAVVVKSFHKTPPFKK